MEVPRHWRLKDERLGFRGSNCPECKIVHFPQRAICPDCGFNNSPITDGEYTHSDGETNTSVIVYSASNSNPVVK